MLRMVCDRVMSIFTLLLMFFLSTLLQTPLLFPPGFTNADFLPMLFLPLGASLAARWWYNSALFLTYGMLGVASFLPAFLTSRRYLALVGSPADELTDILLWLFLPVGGGLLCRWLGSVTQRRPRYVSAISPLLEKWSDEESNAC